MRRGVLLLSLLLLMAMAAVPARAETTRQTFPFNMQLIGCGEVVALSGSLVLASTETTSAAGGLVTTSHIQLEGVTGVGLTTGTRYIGTGVTRESVVFTPADGVAASTVERLHLVATAGGRSYDVREVLHVTRTPDGSLVAYVDNLSASC